MGAMGCSSYRCPACSIYRYGDTYPGSGVCYKSTTSPELLDEYAEHCGFIRVDDRYTIWKFGVPFKELSCGNCQYYTPGEYSHGTCTNKQVKSHPKGMTVNGEKVLINSKEYYSGALACKKFNKKEGENLAKKTYWTKCGIEFPKSTNADVTGYELKLLPTATDPLKVKDDIERVECRTCPFVMLVEEGYPKPVFKRFECRAGSQKPNHKTDWIGSLDDKNTLNINSLDHQFMEEIRQYCKDQPDISASYNTDHLADCRRTLSISCSANKKGIAAKRELIDKFFPVKGTDPQEIEEVKEDCTICMFVKSSDKPGKVKCSEHPKDGDFKPTGDCPQFTPKGVSSVSIYINDPNWDDKWSGNSDDIEYPSCSQDRCPFNDCNRNCLFEDEDPQDEGFNRDVLDAVEGLGCKSERILKQYEAISNTDFTDYTIDAQENDLPTKQSKKKPRIGTETGCNEMREDCLCYCKHNDGCSMLLCKGNALNGLIKTVGDIDCDVYRKVAKKVNGTPEIDTQAPEIANDLAEIDTKPSETVTFDYSTVDDETAGFLQEKASKITEIRLKSVLAIGKELKEAQDKLANNKNGTFGAWTSSIGISRQTAYNYINGYEFIVKNFDNIEAAEDLSPSLLFAAAKKDAPQELTEQVVSGDLTSLKEYKAMEEKLKAAEERAMTYAGRADEAETKAKAREKERDFEANKARDNYIHAQDLQQQLEQAKRNSDPAMVQELGSIITEKQQEIETLKKQLKDKPIEVPAVKEKEVIPDAVRLAIYEKVSRLYEGLCKLTETEIQIFAEDVSEDYRDDVIKGTEDAAEVLADIAHTVWKQTE